jgi:hypothetical protein
VTRLFLTHPQRVLMKVNNKIRYPNRIKLRDGETLVRGSS